jgi:Zn-finger nucleic acid-binding protein
MNCPLCVDEVLDVTHNGGIEIDVCPRCRGIWLDRGELDRLMGPAEPAVRSAAPARSAPRDDGFDDFDEFDDVGGSDPRGSDRNRKKSKKRRLMDKLGDALEEVLDL